MDTGRHVPAKSGQKPDNADYDDDGYRYSLERLGEGQHLHQPNQKAYDQYRYEQGNEHGVLPVLWGTLGAV